MLWGQRHWKGETHGLWEGYIGVSGSGARMGEWPAEEACLAVVMLGFVFPLLRHNSYTSNNRHKYPDTISNTTSASASGC